MPGTILPGTIQLASCPGLIHFQAAQHGDVKVASADQAKGETTVNAGRSRNGAHVAPAGIGQRRVFHAMSRNRSQANDSVLGLEVNLSSGSKIPGDGGWQTNSEVYQVAVFQLLSNALCNEDLTVHNCSFR